MAMSQEALDIILRLQGVPTYTAGMGEASAANDKFAASSSRAAGASDKAAAASERQRGAAALVSKAMKYTSLALVAVAADAVRQAVKWNDLGKEISQTTGLTGKSLESLMNTISKTSEHAPYALGEVADAAVLLKTKFGQTDKQIEKTSGLLIAFSMRAGGTAKEIGTSALSILQDFRNPMSNLVPLMDQLTSVSQATQKPMSGLLSVIEKYGPKLQAMGFNLSDTIKMLGLFQASGVPSAGLGRGLSSALTQAQKTSKETGEGIPEIISQRIREVAHATSEQEAYALALEYFGKMAGPSFARALFHNAGALNEVEKAMRKTGATQGLLSAQQKEVPSKYQELKNQLDAYLRTMGKEFIPILMKVLKDTKGFTVEIIGLTDHGRMLTPVVMGMVGAWLAYKTVMFAVRAVTVAMTLATGLAAAAMWLWDAPITIAIAALYAWDAAVGVATAAQWALNVAMDANPIGLIVVGIAALIAGLVMLIIHFRAVASFLRGPWGYAILWGAIAMEGWIGIPLAIAVHWKTLMSVLNSVAGFVKGAWSKLGPVLAKPFEYLWGKVSWVFKQIKKAISDILNAPSSVLKHITGGIEGIGNSLGITGKAAGGTMGSSGYALINESQQGETVWLPGGSTVQPSPASSLLSPRAHTPNPAPAESGAPIMIEAWLEMPPGAGRSLFKLITREAAIKSARS